MIEEEEESNGFDFSQEEREPKVRRFTDTDLVRWMSILFVFGVYFYIFLKILVIS